MVIMEKFQLINFLLGTDQNYLSVIPTVLVPLTAVTVLLSSIASIIAGWFGVKLKTDGPKKLLELLLKKRIILSAIAFNVLCYACYYGYTYFKNYPSLMMTIEKNIAGTSTDVFENNFPDRIHSFSLNELKVIPQNYKISQTIKIASGSFRSIVPAGPNYYLAQIDGVISELDKASFSEKRKFFIGNFIATRPIIYKDFLISGEGSHDTHHARIYSYDLKSGKLFSTYQSKGHNEGTPIVFNMNGNDYIAFPAGKDGVHVVTFPELKPVWNKFFGHIDSSSHYEDGALYSGVGIEKHKQSNDKRFAVKQNALTGEIIWQQELPLSTWMQPVMSKKYGICYVLGEIYFASDMGFLYCLDKNTGKPTLSIPTNAPVVGKPTIVETETETIIYSADLKGHVLAFDLEKAKIIFDFKPSKESSYSLSSPTFDPATSTIHYAGPMGDYYVLNALTGEIIFEDKFETRSFASVLIYKNKSILVDMKGNLREYTF